MAKRPTDGSFVCVLCIFMHFSLKIIKPVKILNTFFFVFPEILRLMHPTLLYKTLRNLAQLTCTGGEQIWIALNGMKSPERFKSSLFLNENSA